ncbi:MAG: ribokinase [Anaerolineae bacterium]|nr:ribokinase [Anaerolineae bacterium]
MTASIDYLLMGHIAHDRTPDGPQLGGTVSYAAVVAQAMGLRVGILTSARPDDPVLAGLAGINYYLIPAESSTIFVNTYTEHGRMQVVEGHANPLGYADLPQDWRGAPVVHFGPITPALDETLIPQRFPDALVGITPQGYMRTWDAAGRVSPVPWRQAPQMLPHALTVLSDEDLGYSAELEAAYAALAKALVVTRNYNGATLYRGGTRQDFAAPRIQHLCHPTGAGDVFAAALFCTLFLHPEDWALAMESAVSIASTFVETCGAPGAPSLADMQRVLEAPRVRALF